MPKNKMEKWTTVFSHGKDEMNLAEFPITKLGSSDTREVIEYHGQVRKNGAIEQRIWTVRGAAGLGLPAELGERVLMALLAITAQEGFRNKRVEFSVYQILKILGLNLSTRSYRSVDDALKKLAGITVTSDGAWMDRGKKSRVKTSRAFHIIDEFWLRYHEEDEDVIVSEDCQGYIVWSERVWKSFRDGYIKNISLEEYLGFKLPTTRRLYRFLDKRMAYQDEYQIDIYTLANSLGMVPAEYASVLKRPLQKAFKELVDSGYLTSAEFVKHGKYVRAKFSKMPQNIQAPLFDEPEETISLSPDQEWWDDFLAFASAANATAKPMLKKLTLLSKEGGRYIFESPQVDSRFVVNVTAMLTRLLQARGDEVKSIEIVERE